MPYLDDRSLAPGRSALLVCLLACLASVPEPALGAPEPDAASPAALSEAAPGATPTGGAPPAVAAAPSPAKGVETPLVVVVPLKGVVHVASAELIVGALHDAEARGADLIVIEIDTPGGLLSSTEEIQNAMLASRPPVAVLVAPSGASAASAGFFLLETADVAAMAPGTTTGSAHPVTLGGGEQKGDTIPEKKLEHHAAARMRTVVERRGRNVAEAERAVRESVSFTDREALEKKLIDRIVASAEVLVEELDGQSVRRFDGREQTLRLGHARIDRVEVSFRQRLLGAIAMPEVALLLFLIGVAGLYVEFTHPGFVAPGVIGALALLLFLYASTALPVSAAGLALLVLAVVLFALEVKVTSHGVLGAGGLAAMVLGSLMLFKGPMPGVELRLAHVLPMTLALAALILTLTTLAMRSRRQRHVTGPEGLVGEEGTALSAVGPEGGQVFVHGEYWSATAREPVAAGRRVKVTAVDRLQVAVEALPSAGGPDGARPAPAPATAPRSGVG